MAVVDHKFFGLCTARDYSEDSVADLYIAFLRRVRGQSRKIPFPECVAETLREPDKDRVAAKYPRGSNRQP
jgi:hypothetical protein